MAPMRAHAAVGLVGAALVEEHLARRLVGAGEHGAQHRAVGPGGDRLGEVAREADAAVGDHRHARPAAAAATSACAVSWGTPTPATTRVVQIEPGPMPTLTASAPASTRAAPPRGGDVAGDDLGGVGQAPDGATLSITPREWPCAVSTTITSAPAAISASARSSPGRAGADGGTDPQPALLVLAGVGEALRLLDVLDGDQPDQAVAVVDHQQLLDPMLVQEPMASSRPTPSVTVTRRSAVISSRTGRSLRGTKRTSRLVRMPTSGALGPRPRADRRSRAPPSGPARRRAASPARRERVDHHAGLELLDLLDLAACSSTSRFL